MAGPAYYGAIVNIAMNEDWIVPFQFGALDADGVTFVPIDITGSIFKMEIRRHEPEKQVYVSVTNDPPASGIDILDGPNGRFQIAIDRKRLQNLVPGDYVTDLVRELPTGIQERMFEGTATVVLGTSR